MMLPTRIIKKEKNMNNKEYQFFKEFYSHSPSYNYILIWYQIVRGETLKTYITTIYVCIYSCMCIKLRGITLGLGQYISRVKEE